MQKDEMRERRQIIIWPVYLDAARGRNEGRLAPKECSVRSPKASEIFRAAQKLGLNPEMVNDRAHPATWTDRSGMVLVDDKAPKSELLRRIGAEIVRMRGGH